MLIRRHLKLVLRLPEVGKLAFAILFHQLRLLAPAELLKLL